MSISIDYSHEPNFGRCHISGNANVEDAKKIWNEFFTIIQNDKLTALLIIDDTIKSVGAFDVINIMGWLESIRFPKEIKVAIIDPKVSSSININQFGEVVAQTKGWRNIKAFEDELKAMAWIGDMEPQ
jgi:hypothetical protein